MLSRSPGNGFETWKKLVDELDYIKDKAMDEMNNLLEKVKLEKAKDVVSQTV